MKCTKKIIVYFYFHFKIINTYSNIIWGGILKSKKTVDIYEGLKKGLKSEHFKMIRVIRSDGESALTSRSFQEKCYKELGKFF